MPAANPRAVEGPFWARLDTTGGNVLIYRQDRVSGSSLTHGASCRAAHSVFSAPAPVERFTGAGVFNGGANG